jgi:peroxiredoxin
VVRKHNLDIPVLLDPGNKVAASFGLVVTLPPELREVYRSFGIDLERHNGDDSWSLPMPASYVIDRSGVIRSAEINVDHTNRPEPEETLQQLDRLTG